MSADEHPRPVLAEWIQTALTGIGVAVIVTDRRGTIMLMCPMAESLTEWPRAEAVGQPIATVFRIEDEATRHPARDPVTEVLATGTAVGLADHTVLLARGGREMRIDQGADAIRDGSGAIVGVVLIFCDVSERQRLTHGLEEARAFAESIVQTVHEPLVVLDANLRVRTANRAFYQMFRVTAAETEGRSLFKLANRQWDVPQLRRILEEILPRDSSIRDFAVEYNLEGRGRRSMILNARRLPPDGRRPSLILLAIEDATERQQATEALALSEVRYRRLFETAQDGILLVDPETRKVFDANPFLVSLLGYSRDELIGKQLWEIGLFRDIGANKAAFQMLQDKGYIRYEDLPLRTHDGQGIAVEFVSNVYDVGKARVIQCNIRDITDRKRAEEAIRTAYAQLEYRVSERTAELGRTNGALTAEIARREKAEAERRDLQGRLTTAQEDERRHIARELHDQLGQHLTGLGLGLKVVEDAVPSPSPARDRLRELQTLTELIGREVHQLALDLRPTALDDLGLPTALSNYAEAWAERTGIEVDFQSTGVDSGRLRPAVATALYRVVQEALTNVLKHARAHRVSVVLQDASGHIVAVVEDDGDGFDAELARAAEDRLGLLGMRERMELVGGELSIDATPGKGTTIIARVPVPSPNTGAGDG